MCYDSLALSSKNIYTGNMKSEPSPTPARPYHHGDLKRALVLAGIDLLETQGLPGISLRAIAAVVGVSHTAPKNHFGSLRGLLTAIAVEGFHRHTAFMRHGVDAASSQKARQLAALEGYTGFAMTHPHLFEMMFSPLYCDYENADLQRAAAASYGVLADISVGLNWDKATAPDGQRRTEVMLWSLVHGYAKLRLAGQFSDGTPAGAPFDIAAIMPDFGYEPNSEPTGIGLKTL